MNDTTFFQIDCAIEITALCILWVFLKILHELRKIQRDVLESKHWLEGISRMLADLFNEAEDQP